MNKENYEAVLAFALDPTRRELAYHDGGRAFLTIKIAYNESVDFLYMQYRFRSDNPLQIGDNMDYVGFVHYPTARIFDAAYHLFDPPTGFMTESLTDLKTHAEAAIADAIARRVNGKPVPVTDAAEPDQHDRDYYMKYDVDRRARQAFFSKKTHIEYCPYVLLEPNTEETIKMVMNMEGFVADWATDFILHKANSINNRLWEIGVEQKALDQLICTAGEHHVTLAIANSVQGDMKMVNLHIDKEGQQLVVKYPALFLRHADTHDYSTYQIDAPGRRAFEKAFGRSARLAPADIQQITFGKKVLYERADEKALKASGNP